MYTVTTSAPTGHYVNAITALGQGVKSIGGKLYGHHELQFETEEEAKQHLIKVAERLNDADPCGTEERLADMIAGINSSGRLHWDGATADISEADAEE